MGGRLFRYEAARVSSRSTAAMKRARESCIASPARLEHMPFQKEARQRESIAERGALRLAAILLAAQERRQAQHAILPGLARDARNRAA